MSNWSSSCLGCCLTLCPTNVSHTLFAVWPYAQQNCTIVDCCMSPPDFLRTLIVVWSYVLLNFCIPCLFFCIMSNHRPLCMEVCGPTKVPDVLFLFDCVPKLPVHCLFDPTSNRISTYLACGLTLCPTKVPHALFVVWPYVQPKCPTHCLLFDPMSNQSVPRIVCWLTLCPTEVSQIWAVAWPYVQPMCPIPYVLFDLGLTNVSHTTSCLLLDPMSN